jgi:TIR domain
VSCADMEQLDGSKADMAHDVFISYAAQDKATADAVCATLEAPGICRWIAPRDILPGTDGGEAVIEAIYTSRVLILVFSSNANDSHQLKREVERAVSVGLSIASAGGTARQEQRQSRLQDSATWCPGSSGMRDESCGGRARWAQGRVGHLPPSVVSSDWRTRDG